MDDRRCIVDLEELREIVLTLCVARAWDMKPGPRLGFHVMEAAELTEVVRGKGGDPIIEAGDALMTLLAMIPTTIPLAEVVMATREKAARIVREPIGYNAEERLDDERVE